MKEQLLQLYKKNIEAFKSIVQKFPNEDMTGPFLMLPKATYTNQTSPLLVVGQEMGGWTTHIDDPEKQMATYESFDVGRGINNQAFWNTVRKLEGILGNEAHSSAWTNISKFDFYGGRAHGKYEKAIATVDGLLLEELKLLKPGVCIFFTGPYYDNRLQRIFNGLTFEKTGNWNVKQLSRLNHQALPYSTYRCYHPRFLRLKGLEQEFIDFASHIQIYNT